MPNQGWSKGSIAIPRSDIPAYTTISTVCFWPVNALDLTERLIGPFDSQFGNRRTPNRLAGRRIIPVPLKVSKFNFTPTIFRFVIG